MGNFISICNTYKQCGFLILALFCSVVNRMHLVFSVTEIVRVPVLSSSLAKILGFVFVNPREGWKKVCKFANLIRLKLKSGHWPIHGPSHFLHLTSLTSLLCQEIKEQDTLELLLSFP